VNLKSLNAKTKHSRQLHIGVLVVWKGMIWYWGRTQKNAAKLPV